MKILVIEDEPSVSAFIKKGIEEMGDEVFTAFDGEMGLRIALQNNFDLIILDVILPHLNGLEVCKKIRQNSKTHTPILMLSALGNTDDIVTGLDAGADDYLTKPFKFKELTARVRALTRRNFSSDTSKVLKVADLEMNLESKSVKRNEQLIKLTAREFTLLEFLIKNKGKVVSRVDILENVWEINFDMGTNVIDVYVNYLRNKIDKKMSKHIPLAKQKEFFANSKLRLLLAYIEPNLDLTRK